MKINVENNKIYFNDEKVCAGFVLDANDLTTDDLFKIVTWCTDNLNKSTENCENCHL